eukprot:Skav227109  [mRNA]  locus=scaffold199:358357:359361:+ [translate_table: standard]
MLSPRSFRVYCLILFGAFLLQPFPYGFGRTSQRPLSELRESSGLAVRKKVGTSDGPALSQDEKALVVKLARASEGRRWHTARSLFGAYAGSATQVYTAAMHASFRCRKNEEGSKIYEKCRANCEYVGLPAFTVALRIFSKLGDTSRVQQIWDDALKAHRLDGPLASARLVAAAEAGDVQTAAEILDKMNNSNVSIEVHHIDSAIRACWGWGNNQHKAAKYFFDLLSAMEISPTVVSFTSLIGAYKTADLPDLLHAYEEMKSLQIKPDKVFAETYIFSLLRAGNNPRASGAEILEGNCIERAQAARDALADFKSAGLKLTRGCTKVDEELTNMDL